MKARIRCLPAHVLPLSGNPTTLHCSFNSVSHCFDAHFLRNVRISHWQVSQCVSIQAIISFFIICAYTPLNELIDLKLNMFKSDKITQTESKYIWLPPYWAAQLLTRVGYWWMVFVPKPPKRSEILPQRLNRPQKLFPATHSKSPHFDTQRRPASRFNWEKRISQLLHLEFSSKLHNAQSMWSTFGLTLMNPLSLV